MRLESGQRLVATLGDGDVAPLGSENRLQKSPIRLAIINYEQFSIL
jgi:hypothetical protein